MIYLNTLKPILISLFTLSIALVTAIVVHRIIDKILRHFVDQSKSNVDNIIVKQSILPLKIFLILISINIVHPLISLPESVKTFSSQLLTLSWIGLFAFVSIRSVKIFEGYIYDVYKIEVGDNIKVRRIHTQVQVIKRIVFFIIFVISLSAMLMTFERIRLLGTSLLTSAGIIGVIAGMAAQRSLSTVFAGLQIAITQPIRLEDVVIVEGEWGWIEEITLTYVVVRVWDLRRLIVPVTYFIEKPFQNWTRTSADILGTVYIYTDYNIPIAALRDELTKIAKSSTYWDGKTCGLSVTDCKEHTMELRALISASDSSKAWNLRCEVREGLLEFISTNYPESLPKVRASLTTNG